jgi:hypothetical protein
VYRNRTAIALAFARAATARWRPMRWFFLAAAAAALVIAAGACGSTIAVPDQGIVVNGCQAPGQCFLQTCSCKRTELSSCVVDPFCSTPSDRTTCNCVPYPVDSDLGVPTDMGVPTQCLETAQACVGRGDFCGGAGARCLPVGSSCTQSGGDPPMLVSTLSMGDGGVPTLEPHCQFVDDVCCPGTDGGVVGD